VQAGDVAGRRDDATLAAADDDGAGGEVRPVAFLDAGIESVAIDMGDRQREKLRVAHDVAAAAGGAGARCGKVGGAVAADRRHVHAGVLADQAA